MTAPTISLAMIVGNDKDFTGFSIESARYIVDEIIIVMDANTSDGTEDFLSQLAEEEPKLKLFYKKWRLGSSSKSFAMKQCTKDWILFLDSDEVLSDNAFLLKEYIKNPDVDSYSIRGHHFVYNLDLEDDTIPKHYWYQRLVRRTEQLCIPENNYHAVLEGVNGKTEPIEDVRVFHFGYVQNLGKIMRKFYEDSSKPEINHHTKEFMMRWKNDHLLGKYPVKHFKDWDKFPRLVKEWLKI